MYARVTVALKGLMSKKVPASFNEVIVILPLSASNCQQSVATSQTDPALPCGRRAHPDIKKQTSGDAHKNTKRTTSQLSVRKVKTKVVPRQGITISFSPKCVIWKKPFLTDVRSHPTKEL